MESRRVLGVRVDAVDLDAAVDAVEELMGRPAPPMRLVATVNPEFVMRARRDPEFARVLESADLCLADGWGVEWALRRQGRPVPERVPGVDLVSALVHRCAGGGRRVFLLGAMPGVAEQAAAELVRREPGLVVAGCHAGSPEPADDAESAARIAAARPDLLLVAYGFPKQELWVDRNRERLPVPVAIGVGGTFDYLSGRVGRAPAWMRRSGLEWLFRLARQPWRARRMAVLPVFALHVLRGRT